MPNALKQSHKEADVISTLDQCSQNLPKVFGAAPIIFPYAGKTYDVTAMVTELITLSAALKAVTTAKSSWKDAETAAKATRIIARAILAVIQSIAREWFGPTSAQVAELGLKPAKVPAPRKKNVALEAKRSVATQQVAAGKATAKATRAIKTGTGLVDFATGDVTLVASGSTAPAASDSTGATPAPEIAAAPAPSSAAAPAKS